MLASFRLRMSQFYYAVAKGKKTGIFRKWSDCEEQVKGFSGAVFKKFKTQIDAENFIKQKEVNKNPKYLSTNANQFKREASREQEEIEELLRNALEEEGMLSPSEPPRKKYKSNTKDEEELGSLTTNLKKYGDHYFHEDSEGFVQVFTDGSCENNGRECAVAGLGVYFGKNHPLNVSEPVFGRATNNIGEIKASIKAIEEAQSCGITHLNIFTDSQFLINSVCKWMSSWKKNGWVLSSGKPVVNKEDFLVLDELLNSGNIHVKWSYIPAHSGYHGNEEADKLAKEGARKRKL